MVFVDTLFWIASAAPKDQWHTPAVQAKAALGEGVLLVTTDEVLIEFLNALSKKEELRTLAGRIVQSILRNPHVRVHPQTRASFLRGLDRYESRLDKQYSLTDCVSMEVMDSEGIQDILTNDHHFEQEGFTILLKSSGS